MGCCFGRYQAWFYLYNGRRGFVKREPTKLPVNAYGDRHLAWVVVPVTGLPGYHSLGTNPSGISIRIVSPFSSQRSASTVSLPFSLTRTLVASTAWHPPFQLSHAIWRSPSRAPSAAGQFLAAFFSACHIVRQRLPSHAALL